MFLISVFILFLIILFNYEISTKCFIIILLFLAIILLISTYFFKRKIKKLCRRKMVPTNIKLFEVKNVPTNNKSCTHKSTLVKYTNNLFSFIYFIMAILFHTLLFPDTPMSLPPT